MYQELRTVWDELTSAGGRFEVTEVEVRGQVLRTYKHQPLSLREVWLASARYGDADYLVYNDERISYAEAHRQVAQIATWLQGKGVRAGDRVAIAMRNHPEWLLAYWACVSTGVACIGMNAWWAGPEMVYRIEDADPKIIIADRERLEMLMPVRDQIGERILVGARVDELPDGVVAWDELSAGEAELPQVSIDPESFDGSVSVLSDAASSSPPQAAATSANVSIKAKRRSSDRFFPSMEIPLLAWRSPSLVPFVHEQVCG